jgi:hypothetical protein
MEMEMLQGGKQMNYPHLYVKSLLEEAKEENQKMINLNLEYNKRRMKNYHPEDYIDLIKKIEETTLYIEQLNQEIVETIKNIKENK